MANTFGSTCTYQYDVNDRIGKGGYGVVYKAFLQERGDFLGNDIVAVKVLCLEKNEGHPHRPKKAEEKVDYNSVKWTSLLELRHENVVLHHKVTVVTSLHIEIMMDYFPEGDLAAFTKNAKNYIFSAGIAYFGQQIANGLQFLHSKNVIHGDMKPQNILMRRIDYRPLAIGQEHRAYSLHIGDLEGRVIMLHDSTCSKDMKDTCGTARYMSPERVKTMVGQASFTPGRSTDIWSLGCIILDLADFHTGNKMKWLKRKSSSDHPVRVDDMDKFAVLFRIAQDHVPVVNQSIRKDIVKITELCLLEEPSKRPLAGDLLQKLKTVCTDLEAEWAKVIGLDLIRLIGGTVYETVRKDTNETVVVRRHSYPYPMPNNEHSIWLGRIHSRFETAKTLNHPYLVRCLHGQISSPAGDYGPHVQYDILMESCQGGTLHGLLKTFKLPPALLQKWAQQLVEAVAYLHEQRCIHRNINSCEILLSSTNNNSCNLKISGLDVVKRLLTDFTMENDISSNKGICHFSSPEVLSGQRFVGRQTGVWSLGCVIIQMVTGCFPRFFKKDDNGSSVEVTGDLAIMFFIASGGAPALPQNIPHKLQDFIESCIARNPKERLRAADLRNHPFLKASHSETRQWVLPPQDTSFAHADDSGWRCTHWITVDVRSDSSEEP